ncbi:MAG: tRNA pseudouridine(38-40) synthase TruA [Actinomycetota bacterium]|nr:tRNA pseudouridine(38-40) synthase TruA [Actinomycetota bacterium]
MTTTYRLVVSYDGSPFHGFQRQPGLETVQGVLESALARILGTEVVTSGAGRTDAGVHALGQVVSFNSEVKRHPEDLKKRLNSMCGPAIAVLAVDEATPGFDARFSAEARTYEYAIFTREVHDPFCRHTTWHHPQALDVTLMEKAAQALIGEHSFESFGRVEPGKSPVRRVESIEIQQEGDLISIAITANSFLQQMVRSIVGTLVQVGTGRIDPESVDSILHARDRSAAGPVAPPHGLFLVAVGYPEELA